MKERDISALLGKDTTFEGRISFQGTVSIDGHFKGEISAAGGDLIIGENGILEADMHISNIIISGEIHGNIMADQKIDLHPTGKLFGDIQTPILVIHEGAIFEGKARMAYMDRTVQKEISPVDSGKDSVNTPIPLGTIHGVVTSDPLRPNGSLQEIIDAREEDQKGEPIRNATIQAICQGVAKRKTKTDDSGYYELNDLEDGEWTLKVKAKGYETVESIIEISGGGVYEKNFE